MCCQRRAILIEYINMQKRSFVILVGLILFFVVGALFPFEVSAQSTPCPPSSAPTGVITFPNPLGVCSFADLLNKILNFIFWAATLLLPFMVVIGGFLFLTSSGDAAKVKKARDLLLWVGIGYGLILISKGLVIVLQSILGIP